MMPSISVADVSNLCENTLLREAEERIASAVGQSVVDPAPHATRALDAAVLERTGLSGQEILSVLESRMDLLVKFSVRLLKEESSFRDEQEFHPSEGKQDWERDASEPLGLCRGSSLLFACYLWYLDGDKPNELLRFLQRIRIANAKRFHSRLITYHRACRAA